MGAEGQNEDLIFKMRLDVDTKNPITDWPTHEKAIQDLINSKPFIIKLNVDTTAVLAAVNAVNALNTSMSGVSGGKQSTPAQMVVAQAKADKIALDAKTASIVKMMTAEADAAKKALDLEAAEKRLAAATKQSEVADISKEVAIKKKAAAEANAIVAENQRIASIQRVSASVSNSITADNNKIASTHRAITAEINSITADNNKASSASRVISALHGETTAENNAASSANRLKISADGVVSANNRKVISHNQVISSTNRAAQSTLNLERAQQRGIAATHTQNQAYQSQKGIMNGLPQMMNSYISILGMYRFVNSIKDITGEFELQKVALGAIIQDADKANMLFEQIKTKAVESPFMVKDLVTYTKQLAAFKVETESLFGTMNMLADVSAGLGVPMDRLILAYGQVKSASVLRGQELRQFTEAGIPMVQLLADKFTELNGVATSTGDVFDLIRKRGVSFEMVDQIFKDMTASGGTFFNMQEIQSKTLQGIWRNLTDQIQITMDEMGRSNRGILAGSGLALREMVKNWREITEVLSVVISGYGMYKIASLAVAISNNSLARSEAILGAVQKRRTIEQDALAAKTLLYARAQAYYSAGHVKAAIMARAAAESNNILSRSFINLGASMRAMSVGNWVILILTVIAAIGAGIVAIVTHKSKLDLLNEKLAESNNNIKATSDLAISSLKELQRKLSTVAEGSQAYADIISEINKRTKPYIEGQLASAAASLEVEKAVLATTRAIQAQAKAKAQEAAQQISEGEYVASTTKAYKDLEKSITRVTDVNFKKVFSKTDAAKIIQNYKGQYDENPDAYITAGQKQILLIDQVYNLLDDAGKHTKWLSGEAFKGLGKSLMALSDAQKTLSETTAENDRILNIAYPGDIKSREAIEKITKDYGILSKEISKTKWSNDTVHNSTITTNKLFNLETTYIRNLISAYNDLGMAKEASMQEKALKAHLGQNAEWASKIDAMTKPPQGATVLKYGTLGEGAVKFARGGTDMEPQDIFEYYAERQKDYTEVLTKLAAVKSGMNLDKKDIDNLNRDAMQLVAIGKVMGVAFEGLSPKKSGSASTVNPRIAALSSQLSLIEEAYKKYLERMKQIGADAAKVEITSMYGEQNTAAGKASGIALPLAFSSSDMGKNLDTAAKASFNTVEVKTKLLIKKQDTSLDETAAALKLKMEETAAKIDQYQKANDFYEKAFGWTSDYAAAKELVRKMGFTFGNIRKQLQAQLRETMGLGTDADMSDMSSIQKTISGMSAPDVKKAAQDQFNALQEYNIKTMDALNSGNDKYDDNREKRLQIEKDYQDTLRKIKDSGVQGPEKDAWTAKAVRTKEGATADLKYDDLKNLTKYAAAFEDMDRVGRATLSALAVDLQRLVDTGELGLGTLMKVTAKIKELKGKAEGDNPFITMADGINKFVTAMNNMENGTGISLIDDKNMAQEGLDIIIGSIDKMESGLQTLMQPINDSISLAEQLGTAFGFTFSDETQAAIDSFKNGVALISSALAFANSTMAAYKTLAAGVAASQAAIGVASGAAVPGITAMGVALWTALAPILPIIAIIAAAVAAVVGIAYLVNKEDNDTIKDRTKSLEALAAALEKLKREQDKVVGSEYVKNMKAQIANEKQQAADQLAIATATHGKKSQKNKDAHVAAEKAYQEHINNIEDLQAAFLKEMAGTDLASAAKDFASAWLDAYNSFANTMDAMDAKFKDMVNNLIVNAVLSRMAMAALTPVFAAIDAAFANDNTVSNSELAGIIGKGTIASKEFNDLAVAYMAGLEKNGTNTRTTASPTLTGISKSTSTMSEDSANVMGGYLNSNLMQLVQQTKLQQNLVVIGEKQGGTLTDLYNLQNAALSQLQAINSNTSRNAIAAEELVSKVTRLMTPGNNQSLSVTLH